MKKLESSLKNMALALTGFSVVAGGLLGWVNDITAEPIAQANAKTLSDAIAVVVPGFDNNPAEAPETVEVNGATYKIYKATKGGEPTRQSGIRDGSLLPHHAPSERNCRHRRRWQAGWLPASSYRKRPRK